MLSRIAVVSQAQNASLWEFLQKKQWERLPFCDAPTPGLCVAWQDEAKSAARYNRAATQSFIHR
jgi:hypothetical protein